MCVTWLMPYTSFMCHNGSSTESMASSSIQCHDVAANSTWYLLWCGVLYWRLDPGLRCHSVSWCSVYRSKLEEGGSQGRKDTYSLKQDSSIKTINFLLHIWSSLLFWEVLYSCHEMLNDTLWRPLNQHSETQEAKTCTLLIYIPSSRTNSFSGFVISHSGHVRLIGLLD